MAGFDKVLKTGSTTSTLLHDKINPKDCQVLSLDDSGFLQFFRVVSSDYGKPRKTSENTEINVQHASGMTCQSFLGSLAKMKTKTLHPFRRYWISMFRWAETWQKCDVWSQRYPEQQPSIQRTNLAGTATVRLEPKKVKYAAAIQFQWGKALLSSYRWSSWICTGRPVSQKSCFSACGCLLKQKGRADIRRFHLRKSWRDYREANKLITHTPTHTSNTLEDQHFISGSFSQQKVKTIEGCI